MKADLNQNINMTKLKKSYKWSGVLQERGLSLITQKTRGDWGAARKTGVCRCEWSVASLMGVAVAKAELNNTVHLCSNQGCTCTVDFILKPSCFTFFLLSKVVVALVEQNNTVRLLYTWPTATVKHIGLGFKIVKFYARKGFLT